MALLFCDSFDHYETGLSSGFPLGITVKWTEASNLGSCAIVNGVGRCGSNAMQIGGAGAYAAKGLTVAGTANVGYAGFAFKLTTQGGTTPFCGPTNGSNSVPQWQAAVDGSGRIQIYTGNSTAFADLQVQSAPDVIRLNVWYFVEFYWLIHATLGAVTCRVNESQVFAGTNLVTKSTFYGDTNWSAWTLRSAANCQTLFDDLYVLDDVDDGKTPSLATFLGDVSVQYLRPTADGAESQWTVNGGGTHANAVDKNAQNTLRTPYISTTTIGNTDTNIYADPTLTNNCFGVQILILASKADAGTRTLAPVVRQGGVDTVGADQHPSQTDANYLITTYGRNPATGNAWTLTEVANDEYGVKVTG